MSVSEAWNQNAFSISILTTFLLVLDQINERAEWLTEMESLGQGKKYRQEIREQIAERLRRIQSLESKLKMKSDGGFRFVD